MAVIQINADQFAQAKREILAWYPGKNNAGLRASLRAQLADQVAMIDGRENDPIFPARVKLGYGALFIEGSGDQRAINMNDDVNKALGLL